MKLAAENQLKYTIASSSVSALEALKKINSSGLVTMLKFDTKKELTPVGIVLDSAYMGGSWSNTIKEILSFNFDKNKPVGIRSGDKKYLLHGLIDLAHDSYEINKRLPELLAVAIKNGADVNLKNNEGNTPATYALKVFNINNCTKVVSQLIDLGADCKITDKSGNDLLKVLENKVSNCEMSMKTFFKDKVEFKAQLEKIFAGTVVKDEIKKLQSISLDEINDEFEEVIVKKVLKV